MKTVGHEAIHDPGELNVKIDLGEKRKIQKSINALKKKEKEALDPNKIQGLNLDELNKLGEGDKLLNK